MAPCITLSERQVLGFAVELIGPRPFDGRRTQFGRHSVVQPGAISAYRWRIRRAGGTSRNTRDATIEMKPQPQTSSQEVLAGLIERVTYHNAENGFCVLRTKARGHRDVVTVVGHAAAIAAGDGSPPRANGSTTALTVSSSKRGSSGRRPRPRPTASRSTSRQA